MGAARTKRIRAGLLVIAVSVIAMAVLAALKYQQYPRDKGRTWLDRTVIGWRTGQTVQSDMWGNDESVPTYGHLKVKHVLALELIAAGIGGVLVIVGLTTPRDQVVEDKSKGATNG